MACGLPVIASVQAGASENIHDYETGLLLRDPRDPDQLVRLIRWLFDNAELRGRIGEAASRYVRDNCNWDQNVARTREFLEASRQSSG
jgi:phosphatidylinositol alpha-1,6-mannosyltransferase